MKKQINPKKISKWFTIAIIILSLIAIAMVTSFLYANFYQTITQTKEITVLNGKVSFYAVDMKKFNAIIDRLTEKTQPVKSENIISPFR